jgi:hypothetical protein
MFSWSVRSEPGDRFYTFYKQVWPKPAYPYDLFPLIMGAWAVLGAAITFALPRADPADRSGLSEAEGLALEREAV